MLRQKDSRFRKLISCCLLVILLAVTSVFQAPSTYAAPMSLKEVNDRYYAASFLSNCYRQKLEIESPSYGAKALDEIISTRPPGQVFEGVKGFSNTSVTIGQYFAPGEGKIGCQEDSKVTSAMNALGYASIKELLLAIGYTETSKTTDTGFTNTYYVTGDKNASERALDAKKGSQSNSARYFALNRVFAAKCRVSTDITNGVRQDFVEIVEGSTGDGSYVTKNTQIVFVKEDGKPSVDAANKVIKNYDYDKGDLSCKDLLSELNGLAEEYAAYISVPENLQAEGGSQLGMNQSETSENEAVCAAGAIGWLLCPLMTTLSDSVMIGAEIIGNFMQFEPLLGGGPDSSGEAIRGIWQRLVGISNLLLVVAFMVVIFSQATSIGLSAYGIKKMLPRIIAAAILINISYYICALLVDVFNIIGANIGGVIESASNSIPITGELRSDSPGVVAQIAGTVTALITVVGLWGFAAGSVAFLVPILVTALVSVLFIVVVLALRHIMAILLIIVSPLAFAAMILPNTADLFKKWWKGLVTVLALYPVIMTLAYGSLLVSKIILATAPDKAEDNFIIYFLTVAIALVVQVAWIFALKFIVTWGGGLIGKIGGMINDPQKGLIDRSKNWAKSKDARSTLGQSRAWRQQAGDDAAKRRTYGRINSGKGISGTAAHVGAYGLAGLWGEKGILPSSKAAGAIVDVQAAEMADKIHTQSVSYARQKIAQEFSAKDRDSGADGKGLKGLAREAEMAARAGDQVRFDAISSFAASGGADEYRAFHEDMQGRLNVAENPKYRDMFGKSMGFVGATMGGELGPKNPALASVLQTQNPETSIVNSMYNDLGMRKMYNKVGADKHAAYSSDEAKAAALFATDDVVRELIENPGGKHSLGDSARKAYQAEYDKIRNGQARQFANGVGYNENGDGIVGKVRIKDNGAMKDDDGNLLLDPPANPPGQDSLPGM